MAEEKKLPGQITGLVALIATAVFMILGFTIGAWHIIWMVFLVVPVTAIITETVSKKKSNLDSLIGLIAIMAVIVFMLLGFLAGIWHIAWIVFLAIPIAAIIINIVKTAKIERSEDNKSDETQD